MDKKETIHLALDISRIFNSYPKRGRPTKKQVEERNRLNDEYDKMEKSLPFLDFLMNKK